MNDDTIIEIEGSIIRIQATVNNIQHTVNHIQRYINSLHGGEFNIFGDYAEVIYCKSYLTFPAIGSSKNLYIDSSTNLLYRWSNKKMKYYLLGYDINNIKYIDGGNSIV